MKTISLSCLALLMALSLHFTSPTLAGAEEMVLSTPTNTGATLYDGLMKRQSTRAYTPKMISDTDLSNILFAAFGQNRDKGGQVVPVAGPNMAVYVVKKDGAYLYEPKGHKLMKVSDKNLMLQTGAPKVMAEGAEFILVYTTNAGDKQSHYAYVMAGAMSQDVSLYTASNKLASMIRWPGADIDKALGLNKMRTILIQLVGTPK